MRQIQISEELFSRLYSYHVLGKTDALNSRIIQDGLEERMERLLARQRYKQQLDGQDVKPSCNYDRQK